MAYTGVNLPLTGAGDATAAPAVDLIGGLAWQAVKLFDATEGSTRPIIAKTSDPLAADPGLVVRFAPSTAQAGAVTVLNPTSAVELSSGGSTRLVGTVNATGTTKVDVSSGVILGPGSSSNTVGAVAQGAGSTSIAPWYVISSLGAGSTAVDLASGGSTKLVGKVDVNNPTTAVDLASGGSTKLVGRVDVSSGVILGAGSSANVLGAVAQGPGSSANFWFSQPLPFSSGNAARTTVNTSVDVSVIAANANRKALIIANLSTAQIVALGMTTAAVTTALAGVSIYLPPNSQLTFGYSGGMPLFTGPFRGINISSTALGGGVAVTEFT